MKNILTSKPGETSNNLRKVFILFLAFTFLMAAGSLLLRHSIFQKLHILSDKLREHAPVLFVKVNRRPEIDAGSTVDGSSASPEIGRAHV